MLKFQEVALKGKQGFASMDINRRRELASKGGISAHRKGTAHEWSSDEARKAGMKGGRASAKIRGEYYKK